MGQAITAMRMMIDQGWPPKSKFGVDDIPDLTGKVVIVTGGYTGVGYETVKPLLVKNAKVYIAARSKAKADAAIRKLKDETGKDALFLELDLASLKAVKKAAEEFASKETQLHILFNNAGVMWPPVDQLTTDGYDLQFGTNVLGHFYFTELLMPIMLETAKSTSEKVRIVTTSSSGHLAHKGPGIKYDTMRDSPTRKDLNTMDLYFQSKFGNVLIAREVARRYGDQGIVSTSCNPGNLKTELTRYTSGIKLKLINMILYPAPFGALTQLYAGTSPAAADLNGSYLIPWARVGETQPDARDPKAAEELWNWCKEQVKDV